MKITFKSTINHNDEDKVIEFTSPVEISKMEGFDVYEFLEPQNNVMNRIEVSSNVVNIFAGPSTIILMLNELIQNDYQTPQGNIMFDSEMTKLVNKNGYIAMDYTLGQINNPFGKYKIELTISK